MRAKLGENVFEMAVERMRGIFADGHRVAVGFSCGKDSGVSVEICLAAMKLAGKGNGPTPQLDLVMRDEEILYPGSFEYAERMAARPEIKFHWLVAGQPITNVFNRASPYWWVFDRTIPQEEWVRQPPSFHERLDANWIEKINSIDRFPPLPGKRSYSVLGLRAAESIRRNMAIHSMGGYSTGGASDITGMWRALPIYDWQDDDIWKAIADNKWDYNEAYNVMNRMGVPKKDLRIAPPTLNASAAKHLGLASRAWPQWFDRVCRRVKGTRTAAKFGMRACQPLRRFGETWRDCFIRECITHAPAAWIAERATHVMEVKLRRHETHSTAPFPETSPCKVCVENASWKKLAHNLYGGDPFCLKTSDLEEMEPEFFRPGAGTWGKGSPSWG